MPSARGLVTDTSLATLREVDLAANRGKGSAFRAFKSLAGQLVEGEHFHCCDSRADADGFALILASGRLYPGTVNAVFLTSEAQRLVRARMDTAAN